MEMTPRKSWKVPIRFVLGFCTAFVLTASTVFATAPTADVSVTKSNDKSGSIVAGDTITWTIDVTNHGPSGAPGIGLTDTVPAVFENVQASATNPDKCTVVGNLVTCEVKGIGSSTGTDVIIITATLKSDTPTGSIPQNCAAATYSSNSHPDPNTENNSGCESALTVVEAADMQVTKTQTDPAPASNPVLGGTNVTYRIVATNNGPSTATTVSVGDDITVGSATFVSATPVAPNTNGLDCSGFTAFPGSCTVASLASGQSVSFDLVVTAPNDGTASITDHATVSAETFDPDDSNNAVNVSTTICQSVDLSITKACQTFCPPSVGVRDTEVPICEPTPIEGPIPGGSDFAYAITVTNNDSTNTAHNVLFVEPLLGVTFVGVSPNPCTSGDISPDNNCNLGDILAGASVSFTIHVTATDSGPINNIASVSGDECDPNSENNSASCGVTVETANTPTALEADRESSSTDTICETATPTSTSSDINRVFEPGESVRIDPTWHNNLANADADTTGLADTPSSPTGGTLTIDDCSADYGAIPANTDSDCNSATGDCYQMTVTEDVEGVRPHLSDHPRHWDTTFHETLSSGETKTWTLHIGDTFTDVPRSNGFYRFIETILHNRITIGCENGNFFCPGAPVVRAQVAAFIARSLAGNDTLVPTSGTGWNCSTGPSQFTDVTTSNQFCKHINYLKDQKVIFGCTPTTFCPATAANRGQIAIAIARAAEVKLGNTADPDGSIPLFGNSTDGARVYNCDSVDHTNTFDSSNIPAGTPPFTDVAASGDVCKSVGLLFVNHVVDGFGDGTYHPAANIRRDQAAKILVNEFVSLPLYGPLTF